MSSEGDLRHTAGAGRPSALDTCSKAAGTRDTPCAEPGAHLHTPPTVPHLPVEPLEGAAVTNLGTTGGNGATTEGGGRARA